MAESFLLGHEIAHLGMAAESFGVSEQEILAALKARDEDRAQEIVADIIGARLARDAVLSQVGGVFASVPVGSGRRMRAPGCGWRSVTTLCLTSHASANYTAHLV